MGNNPEQTQETSDTSPVGEVITPSVTTNTQVVGNSVTPKSNNSQQTASGLNATVWIYPQVGGVQLYPKLTQGNLSISNEAITLTQEYATQVLQKNVKELVKVSRWSSIMTLTFNDSKVQFDFREPLKWYWRLLGPLAVLNKGWKEQLTAEKPFEDYFRSLGLLNK
jgi:hypothetical protein